MFDIKTLFDEDIPTISRHALSPEGVRIVREYLDEIKRIETEKSRVKEALWEALHADTGTEAFSKDNFTLRTDFIDLGFVCIERKGDGSIVDEVSETAPPPVGAEEIATVA